MGRIAKNVCLILALASTAFAQTKIFPILNGKMSNNLDANGFQITNLDTSNLILGEGVFQEKNGNLDRLSTYGGPGSGEHPDPGNPDAIEYIISDFGLGLLTHTNTIQLFNYLGFVPPDDVDRVPGFYLSAYDAPTGQWTQDQLNYSDITGTAAVNHGGTGQVTTTAAINALVPNQGGHAGDVLTTNGTVISWNGADPASIIAGSSNSISTLTNHGISNVADPTNGQVLGYNSGTGKWEPKNLVSAATGTVSTITVGNLSPLFTSGVSSSTTTPGVLFTLTSAAAHTVFGNPTSGATAPSYYTLNIAALQDAGNLSGWSTKPVPSGTPADIDTAQTLSNKTIDGTNNILKTKKYLDLNHPVRVGDGAKITIDTHSAYSYESRFGNAAPAATNWAEYHFTVPPDLDGTVEVKVIFKFALYLSDSLDQRYIFSIADVGPSENIEKSLGTPITIDYDGEQDGDAGDVESLAGTLTGWKSVLVPGHLAVLRVARDGNATQDPSTIDSVSASLQLEYGSTQ